ncbi:hypothetical protein HF563_12640 [Acidithiobacillus ferridurans]|nr:hypothetical protein [Acidithiobacillus ferridurans]
MTNLRIMTALAIATLAPVAAADTLSQALDTIGVYGEVAATPSSASASVPSGSVSANGGVGITMTGVNQELWYTHLSADYAFGSPINGGSITGTLAGGSGIGSAHVSGHSMAFNARIGKLFAIGEDAAVGPYLAYQYADFKLGLDGITARYQNNAVQLHTLCPECERHDQRYSWHRGGWLTTSDRQHLSAHKRPSGALFYCP